LPSLRVPFAFTCVTGHGLNRLHYRVSLLTRCGEQAKLFHVKH
jgi:hypothetical protein